MTKFMRTQYEVPPPRESYILTYFLPSSLIFFEKWQKYVREIIRGIVMIDIKL